MDKTLIIYILCGIIVLLLIAFLFFIFKKGNALGNVSILLNAKLHGNEIEYYDNSKSVKLIYKKVNNQKDGEEKLFYPTGQLNRIRHWQQGVLNGEMIVFYRNGHIYIKGYYLDGALIGDYTIYKENGDLLTIKKY